MKTLIVGILSLTVLAACATTNKIATVPLPPAGQGFCTANNGIFVILVNDKGEKHAFRCPKINGRPISQPGQLPPGLIDAGKIDLGTARKLKMEDDPDPCIDWVAGGKRYYFCW